MYSLSPEERPLKPFDYLCVNKTTATMLDGKLSPLVFMALTVRCPSGVIITNKIEMCNKTFKSTKASDGLIGYYLRFVSANFLIAASSTAAQFG